MIYGKSFKFLNKVFQELLYTPSQWFSCTSCASRCALVKSLKNFCILNPLLCIQKYRFVHKDKDIVVRYCNPDMFVHFIHCIFKPKCCGSWSLYLYQFRQWTGYKEIIVYNSDYVYIFLKESTDDRCDHHQYFAVHRKSSKSETVH